MMKVGVYLSFLLAYAAWFWGAYKLIKWYNREQSKGKSLWPNEAIVLFQTVALGAFIYLFSGFLNWKLLGFIFGAAQLGIIVSAILWGLLGSSDSQWGPRAAFAGAEFCQKNPNWMIALLVLAILLFVAYPILVGISYFQLPGEQLPARIFQCTLAMLLGWYLLLVPEVIGIFVSPNLDEETRLRYFVVQLGGLVPNALYVALLLWSFGLAGAGNVEVSPLLIGILVCFLLFVVMIPYLIGAQQSRRRATALMNNRIAWLDQLLEILRTPRVSVFAIKLRQLQDSLAQEKSAWTNGDAMIAVRQKLQQGITPAEWDPNALAFPKVRNSDLRFQYYDRLDEFSARVQEISDHLARLRTDKHREKAAQEWVSVLEKNKQEMTQQQAAAESRKTPIVVTLGAVATPIVSTMLNGLAQSIWETFSKSIH